MPAKEQNADAQLSADAQVSVTMEPVGNPALVNVDKAKVDTMGVPLGVVNATALADEEKSEPIQDPSDPRLFHARTEHQQSVGNAGALIDATEVWNKARK